MSAASNGIPDGPADGAERGEALYESSSTRVVRLAPRPGARGIVRKEFLGPHAGQRLRNERSLLALLAGVEGVVQQAVGPDRPDVLDLQDCGGSSLEQVLLAGRCDTAKVLTLAVQLARILARVHRAGVIHRDINPANIVVSDKGEAVLIDFDLAALANRPLPVEPGSRIAGTLGYMAPEQTGRSGRAVDHRADLYSLGATLYEMAVGRPPFGQADALQLVHDHLVREPVPPSQADAGVPRGLSDIIVRLLAKAPERRFQSAEGLLHDLLRLQRELGEGLSGVFELGERDFPARLAAPARLVGREAELAMLGEAFTEAMRTPRRAVLVEGPAGVGKSALVSELKPIVARAGGWYVHGKFDQYQRDGSIAGALMQALCALGRLLLSQSADLVAHQRQRILQGLGRHAGMITRASPEFALLLGDHPYVPEGDPRQAEVQLQQAMLDLLLVVASPECPLVLVVDDLQWAGAISLRLFGQVMMDPQLRGVLLVGAYRTDELHAGHPLEAMLARWNGMEPPPWGISLGNLDAAGLAGMAGQMLRLAPERSRELGEALNVLTGGNPFDTVEMINALRTEGLLSLGEAGWHWDEAKVRRFVGRGHVVDLLAARIGRLPAPSRELLESMSCMGSTVACELLGAAVGLDGEELQARLRPPLEDGLLLAETAGDQDIVRFRHDRVQQAMLAAMDDAQRARRQLAMARRLADQGPFEGAAAQQYLACMPLIDEPAEQRRVVHLFLDFAQVLAGTATYALAQRYLAAADGLLRAVEGPGDAGLRRSLDVASHRALYGLGLVDEADPLFERIQAGTDDPIELVQPTCLQLRSLDRRGHAAEALALGVRLLERLGVRVPADFVDPERERRLLELKGWVARESRLDPSARAPMADRRLTAVSTLLNRMMTAAYTTENEEAFVWILLEAQRLWAQHGPCEHLMGCLTNPSVISRLRDYRTAYEMQRHVIAVGEALGFEIRTAGARFTFAYTACFWFEPLENALGHAARACGDILATGDDPSLACYFHIPTYIYLFEIGPDIDACETEIEAAFLLCRRTGNSAAAALHTCEARLLLALAGKTRSLTSFDDDGFSQRTFLGTNGHLPHLAVASAHVRSLLSLIAGDLDGLAGYVLPDRSHVYEPTYRTTQGHLFLAMARAWRLQQGADAAAGRERLAAELESSREWFARRAADQPHNFLHLLRLVEAEQAWALGDWWRAAALFDAAVLESEARQRPWHRAFIAERAGRFHLARGLAGTALYLLAKARDHYQAWGASAKVEQMHREHAFLRQPSRSLGTHLHKDATGSGSGGGSANISPDVLDLLGVLRASQALSSETSLEQLTARVTEVLAALSGATQARVLSWDEGQWWLVAPAPGEPPLPVARAAERGMVPLSAIGYAERTGEALVVDDALADDRFARDPYFAGVPVCSLLLVPIAGQGTTRAMLLLENRHGRAAFNAQRLDAVMLVAGQLAVSLANARLYESLEQRVHARTRELQETQAQLVATARRAGMAEIANNVLHNVGNVCNSITVSATMALANLTHSRLGGLRKAVDLMKAHEADMGDFMGRDPRGKALREYLDELARTLEEERREVMADLDRLARNVEHVNHVLATQQSHAGASRVLEMARVDELMEEALAMHADAVERQGIRVVREYGQAPPVALDRPRLLQILVNLIANAAQAMEPTPREARVLTLGIAVVDDAQDARGRRLRLSVRDSGEGIAPEHLASIFAHGFTTRAEGHGFGLHSSAVAAVEMDGRLTAHSDGKGRGAHFVLELPVNA